MTSDEMGGILLDGSCSPVCDRVGSPTFLPPSYRSEFRFVGWRFARRVVTAHVGSCRSADFSTPSETHLPYILESLANWLPLCRVAFCWTSLDGLCPMESVQRHFYPLWNPAAIFFLDSRKLTFGLLGGVLLDGSWRPVSDHVGPPTFLPETHLPYISDSLANWLPVCRVVFCKTGRDGLWPIKSVRWHCRPL